MLFGPNIRHTCYERGLPLSYWRTRVSSVLDETLLATQRAGKERVSTALASLEKG